MNTLIEICVVDLAKAGDVSCSLEASFQRLQLRSDYSPLLLSNGELLTPVSIPVVVGGIHSLVSLNGVEKTAYASAIKARQRISEERKSAEQIGIAANAATLVMRANQ